VKNRMLRVSRGRVNGAARRQRNAIFDQTKINRFTSGEMALTSLGIRASIEIGKHSGAFAQLGRRLDGLFTLHTPAMTAHLVSFNTREKWHCACQRRV